MRDVTDGTGRQVLDDIFAESTLLRSDLDGDVGPDDLAAMSLPSDPFVGFYRGTINVDGDTYADADTLVVASDSQSRRYLLKRWEGGKRFKAYQITPVEGERLRLLNVYRVMMGQQVG